MNRWYKGAGSESPRLSGGLLTIADIITTTTSTAAVAAIPMAQAHIVMIGERDADPKEDWVLSLSGDTTLEIGKR